MRRPKPKEVFNTPSDYLTFLTVDSDDRFESQHFERKEVGRNGTDVTDSLLKSVRDGVKKTISAFANANVEGGLLVLGIASDGTISGIDHLSESQKNSLINFPTLLNHQAAEPHEYNCIENLGNEKTILLVFVPHSSSGICETPGPPLQAWFRAGAQNISITQDKRDQIRTDKGLLNFENNPCCEFNPDDVDQEVLAEFRNSFSPEFTREFDDLRLLKEAGAITRRDGKPWFTHAGLLFFGINPQRIFPASYIRLLRFEVSSREYQQRGLPTFEKEFKGPLTKQIRTARLFFRESAFFKRYQKRKNGGGFMEEPEFPSTVIDEAIVNSIAHRDYRTGIPIECEAYQDAFIIKNPGRILQRDQDLPDEFSLSNVVLDSTPRNSKLVEWLKSMKDSDGSEFVKSLSEGTKQMLKAMKALSLPEPQYILGLNETLLKLENNSVEREAAIHAANQIKSTEFVNLFPLRVRNGDTPVPHQILMEHYRELSGILRDALMGNDWFIDKFKFSRLIAHRRGIAHKTPFDVSKILRLYPAYEFQIRQYFEHFYLCIEYRCQVRNVQRLSIVGQQFEKDNLLNRLCIAQDGIWREGKIIEFDMNFARIFFFDTKSEQMIPADKVIPHCSLEMLRTSLQKANISFDLAHAVKKYSLATEKGSARERIERIGNMADYVVPDNKL